MTIFAVISQPGPNHDRLASAVHAAFPDRHYVLGPGTWLVAGLGTAKDVSDKLGVTEGENGSAVILETGSYYGRANPAIWSWIKTNWEVARG